MKHLIYFFLLFSTVVFSQNYQYSIEEAPVKSPPEKPATVVNNQPEEIEYYNAYLLPIEKKATLQAALDKYGSVRLEKGDYSGVNIVMKSNQRLYGHPTLTKVSKITIKAGSSNVHLEDLFPGSANPITLEAGGVISNCTFKTIKWTFLKGTNVMLENNTFINYGGHIQLDCSQSGYIRNNKIIKHQSGSVSNVLIMKGNATTPSYGNVHLHSNYLTPWGDTTDIDGLQTATFVGVDAEGWNLKGEGTKAMFTAKNMGDLKIADFTGGNGYSAVKTPSFDIDAATVSFYNKNLKFPTDVLSLRTNMFLINGKGTYTRKSGITKGFDFLVNLDNSKEITYNNSKQSVTISNSETISTLTKTILGTKYTPWPRTNWKTLPDPLGADWKKDREDQKINKEIDDKTSYIQNLINTQGFVDLPEGIFYISSTLKIPLDKKHGIIGQGTGKTVIVGLTDDFPLITLTGGQDACITLAHLTLQGGNAGIYSSQEYGTQHMSYQNMKFVIFRNQKYGIHLKKIMGFDNNFLENLSFIDCNIGFFQDPFTPFAGNSDTSSFVDKTMFYNNQFLNCGTAVSMRATRAGNLNAWVNCKFDGNNLAFDIAAQNSPIAANCDFTNSKGPNIIRDSPLALYNCNFYNNTTTDAIIRAQGSFLEGCNLMDNIPVFSASVHHYMSNFILNSTIKGNIIRNYGMTQGIFVNSSLSANPTLSKTLVNIKDNVPTVIINSTPNPYPQLLVTH